MKKYRRLCAGYGVTRKTVKRTEARTTEGNEFKSTPETRVDITLVDSH